MNNLKAEPWRNFARAYQN